MTDGKRVKQPERVGFRRRLLLLAVTLCAGLLAAFSLGAMAKSQPEAPRPAPVSAPPPPETHSPPLPIEAVEPPPPAYDFSLPAPETGAVEDDYFSDAVFLGDSRSDGLRLYSGIRGADFLAYKALMVFQVTGTGGVKEKVIPMNGNGDRSTVLQALERKDYGKVYVMFGINELGYKDDEAFRAAFELMIDEIRARQSGAVIYIQSLVPIHKEKSRSVNPAAWLNNDQIAVYNGILRDVAQEKQAVYLDVASALADADGSLPAEGTVDGIHFTKTWYKKWYEYLKTHTVEQALYDAGQVPTEGEKEEAA